MNPSDDTDDAHRPDDWVARYVRDGLRAGPAGKMAVAALQMAGFIVVARLLAPSQFGVYATGFAIGSLVSLGLGGQLAPNVARLPVGADQRAGPRVALIAATVGAISLLSLAAAIPAYRGVLAALTPYIALNAYADLARGRLMARGRAATYAWGDVAYPAAKLATIIIVAAAFGLTPARVALADSVGIGAALLVMSPALRSRQHTVASVPTQQLIWSGVRLLPIPIMWLVINRSDIVMITAFVGEATAGRYQTVLRLTEVVLTISNAVLVLALPVLAQRHALDAFRREYRSVLWLPAALLLGALAGVATFGDAVVRTFVGARYQLPVPFYSLLGAGTAVMVIGSLHWRLLVARRHDRLVAKIALTAVLTNLSLNVALIPAIGPIGGAIGTSVSLTSVALLAARFTRRHVGESPYPSGAIRWQCAAFATQVAVMVVWRLVLGTDLLASISGGLVGTATGMAIMYRWSRLSCSGPTDVTSSHALGADGRL